MLQAYFNHDTNGGVKFHLQDNKFPGAADYQRVVLSQVAPAYKPFGVVSPRFHPNQYYKPTPR